VRRLRGKVPDTSRRTRREQFKALAQFVLALGKAAWAAIERMLRAIQQALTENDYVALGDDNYYPFPSTIVHEFTPITAPLVEALKRKEQQETTPMLVKMDIHDDCLKHEPITFAPAPASAPTGTTTRLFLSITPGVIKTKGMAAKVEQIRKAHDLKPGKVYIPPVVL
jgi:hypothetical protein